MPVPITLYAAKICPWSHKVSISLAESGLQHQIFIINHDDRPEWYSSKVNPAKTTPTLAYGGPDVPPDQPSSESVKLTESSVLLEFVADLSPPGRLLPVDPVEKGKVREFIHEFGVLYGPVWKGVLYDGRDPSDFLTALEMLQSLLPEEGYVVGQWSIADAAVTPFLARLEIYLTLDNGPAGAVWKTFETEPKFARLRKYYQDVTGRESFVKTFDKEHVTQAFRERAASMARK